MAINRLQAALAAATNEVTVAAANLNFDFTLVKYEAPKEYQALGSILSTKRKDNAELGSSHILARQLGALFHGICPETPELLEAYGNRASEIAKASKSASDPYIGTLFGEYTGIDGTSIWAAATSSKSALHVHLLACMLARVWTPPEAVAIWVELVAERKKDIARRLDEGELVNFSLAAAVGQEIARPQLAAWDASARAWLRTADAAFGRKQKQLELILKNIALPVHGEVKVFPSVIGTWKIAVETMNNLITGMPQAVQDGATLLGLSAWHIYPELSVFSPKIIKIDMDDPLVARGGILSLGLAATPRTSRQDNGVYWSLSLAQLRYYGKPVKSNRNLEMEPRITFPQLTLVIFGMLLTEWQIPDSEADLAAKDIILLVDCLNSAQQGSEYDRRLLKMLRDGASAHLEHATGDGDLNYKLIHLGRRRAQDLVRGKENPVQDTEELFGILKPMSFMNALKNQESQIMFLRHIASRIVQTQCSPDAFLIRYGHEDPSLLNPSILEPESEDSDYDYGDSEQEVSESDISNEDTGQQYDEGAGSRSLATKHTTPLPNHHVPTDIESIGKDKNIPDVEKESDVGNGTTMKDAGRTFRIIPEHLANVHVYIDTYNSRIAGEYDQAQTEPEIIPPSEIYTMNQTLDTDTSSTLDYLEEPGFPSYQDYERAKDNLEGSDRYKVEENIHFSYATAIPCHQSAEPGVLLHQRWLASENSFTPLLDGEKCTLHAADKFKSWIDCTQIKGTTDPEAYTYYLLLGDSLGTGLLAQRPLMQDISISAGAGSIITLADVGWCLENDLISPHALYNLLYSDLLSSDLSKSSVTRLTKTLHAFRFAASVYDSLPDATIDVGILERPLVERPWARSLSRSNEDVVRHSRHNAFSLIAYFETGVHEVDPSQLESVIALSSTNSLFVSEPLIQDPYESMTRFGTIRRILGNVGKPGITFLLPPQEPMIRELNPNSWRLDSYRPFDGKRSRSFEGTSVHLSFTEYHVPMFDGSRGGRDNQISFLESVISVRDRGEWVADVNPLPLFDILFQDKLRRLPAQIECSHEREKNSNQAIIAVDSWDELLDRPDGIFVIRTGDNWVARLASTLVVYQRLQGLSTMFSVTVCPSVVCWTCVGQSFRHHAFIY